jgi:hypothetical protein
MRKDPEGDAKLSAGLHIAQLFESAGEFDLIDTLSISLTDVRRVFAHAPPRLQGAGVRDRELSRQDRSTAGT